MNYTPSDRHSSTEAHTFRINPFQSSGFTGLPSRNLAEDIDMEYIVINMVPPLW